MNALLYFMNINTASIELNNEIYISLNNILSKTYAKSLFDKSSYGYGCAIKFYVETVKGYEFVVSGKLRGKVLGVIVWQTHIILKY